MRSPFPKLTRLLPLAVALGLMSGCGSETSSDGAPASANIGGNWQGGQTGSLIPNCGIAPLTRDGTAVPTGEQAFVLYTRGCEMTPNLAELTITDGAGDTVPVELEQLDTGVYLVRGSVVLTEGEYAVTLPEGVTTPASVTMSAMAAMPEGGMPTVVLEVAREAPLPSEAGTLHHDDQSCGVGHFWLRPSAELEPYLALTQFSYSLDGSEPQLSGDYGTLSNSTNMLPIPVAGCPQDECLSVGRHRLTVYATIAGETLQPDPTSIEFEISCDSEGDDGSGCSVRGGAHVRGTVQLFFIALMMLFAATRRRPDRGDK